MTSRCDRDQLSLYAYGFLEEAECEAMVDHLRTCPRCRATAESLLRERDLVAFELGVDAHAFDPEPAALPEAETPPRRPRGRLLRFALAASLLLAASVAVWLSLRPDPPAEAGWRALPDGSRYRVTDRAAVTTPGSIRRLTLDSGSLVLDVAAGEEEFSLATPFGSVKSGGGRFAVSVGPGGTIVEVLEGRARVEPVEGGVERVVPTADGEVHIVYVEISPDPALLARIRELEERVAELGGEVPEEAPSTPEEALEEHDWSGLAGALAEVAPELREGRLPRDPEVLRRYLRRLEELHRLASALGIEPTVEALARDSRTGPRLFVENVRRLWPDAPATDLDSARRGAEDALRKYEAAVAAAATPAETARAEEALKDDLTREVERIEEINGPPVETPAKVEPSTAPTETPKDEGASGEEAAEPSVEEKPAASPAERVLEASGLSKTTSRVYEGTTAELLVVIVNGWVRDRGYPTDRAAALETYARRWIKDYADELSRAAGDVVSAFEARLGRGTAPSGVSDAEVETLRDRLLSVQAAVEGRLPAGTKAPAAPVPTFFLFERATDLVPQATRVR